MRVCTERGGEWKLVAGEAEGEAAEVFSGLRISLVASKEAEGIKSGGCLCAKGTGLRRSEERRVGKECA